MFSSLNRRRGKLLLGKGGGKGDGRSGGQQQRPPPSSSSYDPHHSHDERLQVQGVPSATSATSTMLDDPYDGGSIHGIRSLIGGSGGVSLDGQSLTIPPSSVVLNYSHTAEDGDPSSSYDGYDHRTRGRGHNNHNHHPGSPSMDNSIDLYSYTLSAPGGGTNDIENEAEDEEADLTDEEEDPEEGGLKTKRRTRRGWGSAAGCGAANAFVVVGGGSGDDDEEVNDNKDEEDDEGSASAAKVMMGMTGAHHAGDGDGPNAADGTIDPNHSDLAASSSASALFDGRSLQISSNEDDDMSSINSASLYQGQHHQQQQMMSPSSSSGPNPPPMQYYGASASSLSSLPPSLGGFTPSPATSNKYLGPYGSSKLKIIGSINLVNDLDNSADDLPNSRRDATASRRMMQGPAGVADGPCDGKDDDLAAGDQAAPFCGCRCAPLWIKRAPRWLQIVLFASAVLALLAVVLVAVSVSLAFHARGSAASSASSASSGSSNDGDDAAPFVPPPLLNNNTSTTGNSTDNNPSTGASNATDGSISNGTLNNITNVSNNSSTPVDWSSLLRTSFAVTAGRYPDALAQIVPALLPNFTETPTVNTASIPGGDSTTGETGQVESWLQFLVNLGDWNSPSYTDCVEAAYQDVADMFSTSDVPVYFVPGDNEYNDCIGQEQLALTRWRNTLVDYESSYWTLPYTTETRQVDSLPENFAFVYRQVIFVGLNLVSGNVYDQDVWDARLASDLEWVEQAYDAYHNVTRAMVLFSHSSPDNTLNLAFFDSLLANVSSTWTDLEFVIMHRNNPGQVMEHTLQYSGIANLQVVSVLGSVWPPLRATVMIDTTMESGAGVTVQVEQDTLYQETPQG